MQKHEHFEELCALVPIGQLTASEYQELAEHLKGCVACRHATEDFALVLDQLPVADTDVDDQTLLSLQGDSYRERFLKRASEEGVPFSNEILHPQSGLRLWNRPRRRSFYSFAFAAAAMVILVAALYQNFYRIPTQAPVVARAS